MIEATMFEAKTDLSRLVRLAQQGEKVVITNGKDRTPVAQIVAIVVGPRKLGVCLNPDFKLPKSFHDPLPEDELTLWSGEGK
jgi:antitoxin (DNA-binding transcriptional repressor) of toxin-antitoxin stability system